MSRSFALDPEYFVAQLPKALQEKINSPNNPTSLVHKLQAKEISLIAEVQAYLDAKVEEFAHYTESLFSHENVLSPTPDDTHEMHTLIKTISPLSPVYNSIKKPTSNFPLKSSLKLKSSNSAASGGIVSTSQDESSSDEGSESPPESENRQGQSIDIKGNTKHNSDSKKKKVMFSNNDQIAILPPADLELNSSPEQSFNTIGEIFGHGKLESYPPTSLSSDSPCDPATLSPQDRGSLSPKDFYDDEDNIYIDFQKTLASGVAKEEEDFSLDKPPSEEVAKILKSMVDASQDTPPISSEENTEELDINPDVGSGHKFFPVMGSSDISGSEDNTQDSQLSDSKVFAYENASNRLNSNQDDNTNVKSIDKKANEIQAQAIEKLLPQTIAAPKVLSNTDSIDMSDPIVKEAAKALEENVNSDEEITQQKTALYAAQKNKKMIIEDIKNENEGLPEQAKKSIKTNEYAKRGQPSTTYSNCPNNEPSETTQVNNSSVKKSTDSDSESSIEYYGDNDDDEDDDIFQLDETLGIEPSGPSLSPYIDSDTTNTITEMSRMKSSNFNIIPSSLPSNKSRTSVNEQPTVVGSLKPRSMKKYKARYLSKNEHSLDDIEESDNEIDDKNAGQSALFAKQPINAIKTTSKVTKTLPNQDILYKSNFSSSLPINISAFGQLSNASLNQNLEEATVTSEKPSSSKINDILLSEDILDTNPTLVERELNDPLLNEDIALYASPKSAAQLIHKDTNPQSMSFSQRLMMERWKNNQPSTSIYDR